MQHRTPQEVFPTSGHQPVTLCWEGWWKQYQYKVQYYFKCHVLYYFSLFNIIYKTSFSQCREQYFFDFVCNISFYYLSLSSYILPFLSIFHPNLLIILICLNTYCYSLWYWCQQLLLWHSSVITRLFGHFNFFYVTVSFGTTFSSGPYKVLYYLT